MFAPRHSNENKMVDFLFFSRLICILMSAYQKNKMQSFLGVFKEQLQPQNWTLVPWCKGFYDVWHLTDSFIHSLFKYVLTLRPRNPALGVINLNIRRQPYGLSKHAVSFYSVPGRVKKLHYLKTLFTLTLYNNFGPVLQ